MRVLVADDDRLTCEFITSALEPEHEVEAWSSGFSLLLQPGAFEGVDVAIIDLVLSAEFTGHALLAFLGACCPSVWRVAMTAARVNGPSTPVDAEAVLLKPFGIDALRAALGP